MPTEDATYTVLVTWTDLAEPGPSMLRDAGCDVVFLTETKDKAEVDKLLGTCEIDAVISRTIELDADALRSCPSLKVISKHGVGVNNIDVDAATALCIPVTNTPGANSQSVAELTLGLMITAARRIPWLHDHVKHGRWRRVQDGYQLGGQTLGLVGLGQVGRRVATAARALGMAVAVFDPAIAEDDAPPGVRVCGELTDVLRMANVLSLHVPLTDGTRGLIGREQIDLLPDGSIIVNTSRGPVIHEPALVDALRSGKLRAAGLDTTAIEPIRPDDPLLELENVFITPHIGGSTTASASAVAAAAAENLLAVLRGAAVQLDRQVNPEVFDARGRA
ncbi:MAG: hydroxyacid dehydrogenase [Pseudonocardiaceae bacterium]|nr:hydroxyacid dehydrogenase [Pseudonocardiaceae bacterium]